MKFNLNEVKFMGVMNLTPDSFSENTQTQTFPELISSYEPFDILDIGAESTAPSNKAISEAEELKRFDQYWDQIFAHKKFQMISIDTYKPEVFKACYRKIKSFDSSIKIIWNDISGKLDHEFFDVVTELHGDFTYIVGHNLALTRKDSSSHADFIPISLNLDQLKFYFEAHIRTLVDLKLPFMIDPLPGFSKSREQNHFLLKEFHQLLNSFDYPFVWAISRKSFLRFPREMDPKLIANKKKIDELMGLLTFDLLKRVNNKTIILRVHDDSLYYSLKNYSNIMTL
jgi:dihydropteroate synthase